MVLKIMATIGVVFLLGVAACSNESPRELYENIHLGMNESQVVSILGVPDNETIVQTKKTLEWNWGKRSIVVTLNEGIVSQKRFITPLPD